MIKTVHCGCCLCVSCWLFGLWYFSHLLSHCAELCCPVQAKLSTNQHSTYIQRHCYMSLSAAYPEWRKGSTQVDKHTSGSRSCFFCACKKLQKPNSTLIILLWSRAEFCRLVYWPCWTPGCMNVSFFSAISMIYQYRSSEMVWLQSRRCCNSLKACFLL